MLSALAHLFEAPVSLAVCAAVVLVAMLLLIAVVSWAVLRRANRSEVPETLLGLAHMISALCGLLPWGKPTPPPALPQPRGPEPEAAAPTVVLVREETASAFLSQRGDV